jgi:hypothetical protein
VITPQETGAAHIDTWISNCTILRAVKIGDQKGERSMATMSHPTIRTDESIRIAVVDELK